MNDKTPTIDIATIRSFLDQGVGMGGQFMSNSGFGHGNSESLGDELTRRFDVVVGMSQHQTAEKGTSMATFGLCGCIGGYIDNPETSTFFHYDSFGAPMIDLLVKQNCSEQTTKLHLFVPGEWQRNKAGKYEQVPKAEYTDRILAPALASAQVQGVEVEFHCYDKNQMDGARYQGTAWVDKNGTVFQDQMIVANNPHKPEAEPPTTLDC